MDWHCWILLLLQASALSSSQTAAVFAEVNEKRLSFLQHSKCTYSYEVAVHTARGSKSTESEGYHIHAVVSTYNYLVIFSCFELQSLFSRHKMRLGKTSFAV